MIGKRRFRAGNGTELPYLLYAPEERGDGPLPCPGAEPETDM